RIRRAADVDQHEHRGIAPTRAETAIEPRGHVTAGAQVGTGVDARLEVELVTVVLPPLPDAMRAQHLEAAPDRGEHAALRIERALDPLRRTLAGKRFPDRRAGIPVGLTPIVPLRI